MRQMTEQELKQDQIECRICFFIVAVFGVVGLILLCNAQAPLGELRAYYRLPVEYRLVQQEAYWDGGMTFEGATQYARQYSEEYPRYMRHLLAYEQGTIPNHPPEPTSPEGFLQAHPQYTAR